MKILILCALSIAAALAEPPVNNRYLPPQQAFSGGFSEPSKTYGPPAGSSGYSGQRQTDAVFGGRPSSTYGTPSFNSRSRPSNQYNSPRTQSTTNQYLPPSQDQQYNPAARYQEPSSQYRAPSSFQAPSSQYGAPSQNQLSNQYGAPSFTNSAPSQQYGAPGTGGSAQRSNNGFGSSSGFSGTDRSYLPPGRRGYDADEDGNGEPANYSFEYMVKDEPSGNDFGHKESRQGDRAEGVYYVLLPDGRKQIVQYEADQNGYKPRISYEDIGLAGGYDRNAQAGYQGFDNQAGPY